MNLRNILIWSLPEMFVCLDFVLSDYLYQFSRRTYNTYPELIYSFLSYTVFGCLLGFIMLGGVKKTFKAFLVLFLINVIAAISLFWWKHQTPDYLLILSGFSLIQMFFIP